MTTPARRILPLAALAAISVLAACGARSVHEAAAPARSDSNAAQAKSPPMARGFLSGDDAVPRADLLGPGGEPKSPGGLEVARRLATDADLRPRAPALLARPDGPEEKELPLEALRVSTVLGATRARTLIDCTFGNPHAQDLQGTLKVKLPDGASPCALAMFLGGGAATGVDAASFLPPPLESPDSLFLSTLRLPAKWNGSSGTTVVDWGELRPARTIEEREAAVAYEQVTRRRVDPALMEWSGGNAFSTRIFPIPHGAHKRVVFVYDHPLVSAGSRLAAVAPVPTKVPPAFRLEVAAERAAYADASLVRATADGALESGGDFFRGSHVPAADEKGAFLVAGTPRRAKVQAGFAETSRAGTLVHALVRPKASLRKAAPTGRAVFLLDTSLSQRTKLAASLGRVLRAVLEKDSTIERFSVVTFDVAARALFEGARANTPEERERTLRDVEGLWLEGATSAEAALAGLERALPEGEDATVFLLSDAQVTWGIEDVRELERAHPRAFARRWICYQVGDAAVNRPLLERLAFAGGRVVSVVSAQDVGAAALAHRTAATALRSVKVAGIPSTDLVVAGSPRALYPDQVVEVAFRAPAGTDPTKARVVVETEDGTEELPLSDAAPADACAARAWAELAATTLLELRDRDADDLALALSQEFGLANRVASLLILETDADWKRFPLRQAELDLARLSKAASAKQARRPAGAPDVSALDSNALAFLESLGDARSTPWARPKLPAAQGKAGEPTRWGERIDTTAVWRESVRRFERGLGDEAVRVLSSIVEENPREARALRLAGFALMSFGRYEEARDLFARVRTLRPFEPQAFACEALALEALGRAGEAALRYEVVLAGKFDPRWERYAKEEVRRLYARLLAGLGSAPALARRDALGLPADLPAHEIHLLWNLDDTDVDLHVQESGFFGAHVHYSNLRSSGGELLWDNTSGLGPEIYVHKDQEPAQVFTHYFGTSSVEGTVPSATLLVYFRGRDTLVRHAVLADRKEKVVLYDPSSTE